MNNPDSQQVQTLNDQHMTNAKGFLVPISKVKPIDKLRDEVVRALHRRATELQGQMRQAKRDFFKDFTDFCELSASDYDVIWGGKKGNVTLTSYDGSLKIALQVADLQVFDERLQVAKQLIDECVVEWSAGANDNTKALIAHAFRVDKKGNINTGSVLSLRQLDIDDPKWLEAMKAISDSLTVADTTEYMRFYVRDEHDKYQAISLDFANL